jgi:hypothetical protein
MTHRLVLSDDQQQIVAELALAFVGGQSPEEVTQTLLEEAWGRACASYDVAFDNDPAWLAGAQEAVAEVAAGPASSFRSTDAFLAHLEERQSDLDASQQLDEPTAGPDDADAR